MGGQTGGQQKIWGAMTHPVLPLESPLIISTKLSPNLECWHYLLPSSWFLLITADVVVCDHAALLSKFGILIIDAEL